jgi:hypothetical protein
MDYEITFTISEHGRDPEAGARFLEGFLSTHPETDPVVEQNLETGELSVSITVSADDPYVAVDAARPILVEGADASGLAVTDIVSMLVEHVGVAEPRELVEA